MKGRFTSLDIVALIPELNAKLKGLRVNQIYDVDHKTYLVRFGTTQHKDEVAIDDDDANNKIILILESGVRFHTTTFQWPKSFTPSGFTMKLRKHLKNKRLEHIQQLGADRIVDFQFGSGEAAYHIILELYDRGNIIITDYEWTILNILRPRTEADADVKFCVREKYPVHLAKKEKDYPLPTETDIQNLVAASKAGDTLRKVFVPKVIFGPALLEHSFIEEGLPPNSKIRDVIGPNGVTTILNCFNRADNIFRMVSQKKVNSGIVVSIEDKKVIKDLTKGVDSEEMKEVVDIDYKDFHPFLFSQFKNLVDASITPRNPGKHDLLHKFDSFDQAVDFYFSSVKGQKLDSKQRQLEKEALMKLERVRLDHEKRLQELAEAQAKDEAKADLILANAEVVEKALSIIRDALQKKMSWESIQEMIKETDDEVCRMIRSLDLAANKFSIELTDPFDESENPPSQVLAIDIDLSSYANARKYHDHRKHAAEKEDKTIKSSEKALKSAQVKTTKALKEVAVKTSISKSRKIYWFEKFYWAISSENYLMIAGRDAQQNELVVKRYMKPGDIYVHADLHGAASVIVKNNDPNQEIPPRTLEEAATMAVCYSSAWDAKIVTKSWWVRPDQVSKTAPSGEYLTVGAFMIRGKKNYLPMTQLILGFGFLFKVSDECIDRHLNERSLRLKDGSVIEDEEEEAEIPVDDDGEDDDGDFPDTKVRTLSINNSEVGEDDEDEVTVVKSAEPRSKKQYQLTKLKRDAQKKAAKEQTVEKKVMDVQEALKLPDTTQTLNSRQRSKLKKIKKKYKDQDEEDRLVQMALLGKLGSFKDVGKKNKKKPPTAIETLTNLDKDDDLKKVSDVVEVTVADVNENGTNEPEEMEDEVTELITQPPPDEEDEDDDEEVTQSVKQSQDRMLASLTGQPLPEDDLLFCVPVVGPYSCMTNYKYKVKVTPGSNRRGKAGKTALHIFTVDKNGSRREKDLLKSAKDMDVAKNLPGKIKISSANLSSSVKKRG